MSRIVEGVDPYEHCEEPVRCNHELPRGVLLSDLLSDQDGPYRPDPKLMVPIIIGGRIQMVDENGE